MPETNPHYVSEIREPLNQAPFIKWQPVNYVRMVHHLCCAVRCLAANESLAALQCIELAADEKTLLAFEPISRIVPTTITRMTASIAAYSAMS